MSWSRRLQDELASWRLRSRFCIPLTESGLIAEVHRIGHVLELRYEGDSAIIVAHIPPQLEQRLECVSDRMIATDGQTGRKQAPTPTSPQKVGLATEGKSKIPSRSHAGGAQGRLLA